MSSNIVYMEKDPRLSVVVPVFNEAESLEELYVQIKSVCEAEKIEYEVIFVDDGSTDESWRFMENMHELDKRVKAIQFRKNYGKAEALSAGFEAARGHYVITMDGDLQDDPAEIPKLIQKLEEGYDLVTGWKKKRHDPANKTLPSKLFNALTSWMSGISLHDFNCGLKIYRKEVVKNLHVYGDLHRYIPALAHLEGFHVTELEVHHRARKYGHTKYGFARSKGMLDLLTVVFLSKYNRRPLHLFGLMGFWSFAAGMLITLYLVLLRIMKIIYLSNRPLLFIGILLMIIGVQFVSLGLIGEMITRSQVSSPERSIRKGLGV